MWKLWTIFALMLAARTSFADEPYTPKQGSAVRTEICRAFRESRPQTSHQFFVRFLLVQGEWALVDVVESDTAEGEIAAALRRVNGKWTLVSARLHDDVAAGSEFREDGKPENPPESLCKAWDERRNRGTEKSGPAF
jgi:hypothetical protein